MASAERRAARYDFHFGGSRAQRRGSFVHEARANGDAAGIAQRQANARAHAERGA